MNRLRDPGASPHGAIDENVETIKAWDQALLHERSTAEQFSDWITTMVVSLEAIFLALFVLASQNRLAKQSDKRANLDLQIDLLAEREMTAVLQLLRDIAGHLNVDTVTAEELNWPARPTSRPWPVKLIGSNWANRFPLAAGTLELAAWPASCKHKRL